MANARTFQRSFAGGELSPEMFGRIDDVKYQSGAALVRNFIVTPTGPLQNRPGTRFVAACKTFLGKYDKAVRLIPFTYSNTQTMVLEFGHKYVRFHTQGQTLLNSDQNPYEIVTPYAAEHLFDIHYVQSADVLTLVHPSYAPRELRRYGATDWRLVEINFAAPISAPSTVEVSCSVSGTKSTPHYAVTALAADQFSESVASTAAYDNSADPYATGAITTISWSSVAGASRYNVYKGVSGVYGYIGSSAGLSITDDNIAPDTSRTPPVYDTPFTTAKSIKSVAVANGGHDYSSAASGGTFVSLGFKSPALWAPYLNGLVGTISLYATDPTGSGASFALVKSGLVYTGGITITNAGSGYSQPVFVLASSNANDRDMISNLNSNLNSGLTYTLTPNIPGGLTQISVSDTTGSGAVVRPVVENGVITSVTVINGGQNYTNPTFTVTDGGGTGSNAVIGPATISATGDNPGAVSYFEQRRVFAGTTYKPQNIWMTKSGTESDMSYCLPIRDNDRISFRVAAREANAIRHIVPLSQLLILTGAAEWRVTSVNSDAITPTSVAVRPQSYVGASNVQPVVVNNTLVYAAARGGHVRECAYNWQASGFITGDLSLRAAHLFDTLEIVDMAYSKAPQPILWFVSSSGRLLGCTYIPEQQVGAWHQHITQGSFQSCCVVAEGGEDVLYAVVARSVNGAYVRYVERFATRQFTGLADAYHVDCGVTYRGSATGTVSGLNHLEGCTVNILADGVVQPQQVVTGGAITLAGNLTATTIQVGLPIVADLQTLPLALQIDGFGQGRMKNVNRCWLRLYQSSGIFVGPRSDKLVPVKQAADYVDAAEVRVDLIPSWDDGGQVYVRQTAPLPLTVVGMTLEVSVGG